MDIQYTDRQIVLSEKVLTDLDRFVMDFTRLLEKSTPYVIVNGYVAILFGRSRGTEDIDILIPTLEWDTFGHLHRELITGDFEFLNAEDDDGLYDMLARGMGIRIAKLDQFIPNIELTFLKDDVDRHVLENRIAVTIPDASFFISPVDIQITYNLYLGSDKDIKDAVYPWEIFKDDIDDTRVKKWMKKIRYYPRRVWNVRVIKKNRRMERLAFVRSYAAWVKRTPNAEWSREQALFINSLVANARYMPLSCEVYLERVVGRRHPIQDRER